MKPILTLLVICLWLSSFSQQGILKNEISINPGTYSPKEVIEVIEKSGTGLSFPEPLLKKDTITLDKNTYLLEDLLSIIFYIENAQFLAREDKVLITYKKKASVTYSGYIEEAVSQERLIGVSIYIPDFNTGTVTNNYGFYSITIPVSAPVKAEISFIGYATKDVLLKPEVSDTDIIISPVSITLQEATVSAEKLLSQETQMSQVKLNQQQIEDIPAFFGEPDILKGMHMLPGVQMASEGNTNFLVRGGSADQNLILLDGAPVYNASHLFGFFSVFNSDAVKYVELTKGGFSARYGGRLSSVLEVNTKEGGMQEYHGSGGIGLLSADFTIEGPIVKNKTSFMFSGRRTYSDLIYRLFNRNTFHYYFGDINIKINHKFSRKDRVYLSFYSGKDELEYTLNSTFVNLNWGNYTTVARWNHLFNQKLFGNLSVYHTRYRLNFELGFDFMGKNINNLYFSQVEDIGARYDFEYNLNSKHHLEYGLNTTFHTFKPGVFSSNDLIFDLSNFIETSPSTYSFDTYAYIQDEWQVNPKIILRPGVHLAYYQAGKKPYVNPQPRLAALYKLSPKWSLKASATSTVQYIHLLSNPGTSLPTDIWVSSSDRIKPQKQWQLSFGTAGSLFNDMFEVQSEVFYREFSNLIDYKITASNAITSNWENQVVTDGTGKAYGFEFQLRKSAGNLTGWLAYTYSRSFRKFKEFNNGELFPYIYDRPHDFKIALKQRFSDHFNLGINWVYSNGRRGTVEIGKFLNAEGEKASLYSGKNAYQYPDYHRLDLAFNFIKKTRWGQYTVSIGAYNVYNHLNAFTVVKGNFFDSGITNDPTVYQLSLFPILPYVSYQFKF